MKHFFKIFLALQIAFFLSACTHVQLGAPHEKAPSSRHDSRWNPHDKSVVGNY